jgi:hypothetical protein
VSPTPVADEYTVRAARNGSRPAREAVVAGYLPLVYNAVGWAVPVGADVTGVVRETLLHMVGGLGDLVDPARMRSWVMAVTVHQVQKAYPRRSRSPSAGAGTDGDFADLAIARLALSGQRRELAEATRWLDTDDRYLLGLWWLEACGQLSRRDLIAALRLPADQVAARVLRLRAQLDAARAVVRALAAGPPCPRRAELLRGWRGEPAPAWRGRLARHRRECRDCGGSGDPLDEPELLLAGLPLVAPEPELIHRAARLASAHPRIHKWTARHLARPAPSHAGQAVTAALTSLLLVAAAGVAFALGTRAVGQSPATTAVDDPPAAAGIRTGSPAATPPDHPATGGAQPLAAATPAPPFSDRVPAVPSVLSVTELDPVRQHARVTARDGGQSTRYGDRSVWIFGDTVLRNPWGFLSNTGAATTDLYAPDGITITATTPFQTTDTGTGPDELIPRTAAELAFEKAHAASTGCTPDRDPYCGVRFGLWPGPVIADPARHRVLILYNKICRGTRGRMPCSGGFGKALGSGVAQLDMLTGKVTRLTATSTRAVFSVEGTDRTMFFPPSTEYASAALVVGDTAYVYGDCRIGCKLARVPLAQVTDRSRWQFFTGRDLTGADQWSTDPGAAVDTIAAGAAGGTVLGCPALHGYLNLFMPYGTNTLMYQIGGSPFGPWSSAYQLLVTDPDGPIPNYAAYGHPEYAERDGLVQYVTYYQRSTGALHVVRVTFFP